MRAEIQKSGSDVE
jgi:hypothetical protein